MFIPHSLRNIQNIFFIDMRREKESKAAAEEEEEEAVEKAAPGPKKRTYSMDEPLKRQTSFSLDEPKDETMVSRALLVS